MKPELTELIESYREGKTSRRKFMKKLAVLAGSTAAATSVLALLDPGEATAGPRKDPDIELTEKFVSYPGKTGEVRAFLAVPAGSQAFPAVIVIHENKGLQPHIRDVASRMAREGLL